MLICLIYKTLDILIFNTNLTFYGIFHLVAMLHLSIKKSAKSGFWIYDIRYTIWDLRFTILDFGFTKTEC